MGGAGHRAEREDTGRQQDDRAAAVRHALLARHVLLTPAAVPRYQHRGLPRDAFGRPERRKAYRAPQGGIRILGASDGQGSGLQLANVLVACRPGGDRKCVFTARLFIQVVLRRDGTARHRHWLRLGESGDSQVHRRARGTDSSPDGRRQRPDLQQRFRRVPPAQARHHLQVRRQPGPHRRRRDRRRRHGPAVLRQRHVRRAVRLLLRLAQADRRLRLPRTLPPPADRQGQRGRREPGPLEGREGRQGARRQGLPGTAWRRSSRSVVACSSPTGS